ncbi:hypothetical protein mRhiFer1_008325 [Rhinolophus ferrumequinum]|uniref:Uncharacterized protein n=1 Tax=Rhinolophus ferrumequinum TaxID=59479 RepID=A0A7J7VR52_RHIFE|nr:hypothetical protein mRhiFer1_008325 [Rhinolophus ferrumequinum]
MSLCPRGMQSPPGQVPLSGGCLRTRKLLTLLPSQWYCLRPESEVCVCPVLLPGGDVCQPCYGWGENRVFTSLCPCCSRPLQRRPPCSRAGGPSGSPVSCRVVSASPPSLCTGGQLSPLAGLPAQGSCSSWTGLWPAQNKCSWGGSTPVMPPPDFSWPLTFGWLGQTLFSLPGCCMRSSDILSSMPNLLVKPGLHVCPLPSGSGTALCREQADAGRWDSWPLLARVLVATLHPGVPLRPLLLPPGLALTFSLLAWEGGRGVRDGGQPGGATRQPAKA